MTDKIVIMVTAANHEECRKIAAYLVESKLAACVNITPRVESIYRWEGKTTCENEYQLFIKSSRALFGEIRAAVSRLHSYENPEIIGLPIVEGSQSYLEWIADSVETHDGEDATEETK